MLGEALYLGSGTLTPLLKRMEAAGFITRSRDAKDERRVFVDLTEKGRMLRDAAEPVPFTLAAEFAGDLTQLATLRSSFAHWWLFWAAMLP